MQDAEGERRADANQSGGVLALNLNGLLEVMNQRQRFFAMRQKRIALVGHRQATRGAIHQPHAQTLFQLRHIARHYCLGSFHPVGCAHKAARFRLGDGLLHFLKFVHDAPYLLNHCVNN